MKRPLSRREFLQLLEGAAVVDLILQSGMPVAWSQTINAPTQEDLYHESFARTEYLLSVSESITKSIEDYINRIDSYLSHFSGTSYIATIGIQTESNVGNASLTLTSGMFVAFNFNTGELERGHFFTATTAASTDPFPAIAGGLEASIGRGTINGFMGESMAQSVGGLNAQLSMSENDEYLGISAAVVPGLTLPTATVSVESETSGMSDVVTDNVYSEWSELSEYLFGR